jgi:hypothetical protein
MSRTGLANCGSRASTRPGHAHERMVLGLARGEDLSLRRVDLVTELIVRASTAPPRR